jgi:hypothetical protein
MILLTSLLRREDLKDIILRWMCNQLLQEDCENIKKIVNFNVHVLNLYLGSFCNDLFSYLSGAEIWSFQVTTKGQLKDFIIDAATYKDERLEHIRTRYKRYPEDFYRSTPFHGEIYGAGAKEHPTYLGHSRIKRFRRVAEKASRRMIGIIFDEIKKRADALAFERASRLGVPKHELVTPLEEQKEEFIHAERRLIKQLRQGIFYPNEAIVQTGKIQDVAGVKVVIDDDRTHDFERFFDDKQNCSISEKEEHTGAYGATNYIIDLRLDKKMLLERLPDTRVTDVLSTRGMNRDTIIEDYKTFIETAEDNVFFEVITCNYPEMIESEFGRSMHEERILAQREQVEYRSSIARNVRYITEYLFLFAVSGKKCIQELPIKLWEKTIPDTYDHAIRELWDIPTTPVL